MSAEREVKVMMVEIAVILACFLTVVVAQVWFPPKPAVNHNARPDCVECWTRQHDGCSVMMCTNVCEQQATLVMVPLRCGR